MSKLPQTSHLGSRDIKLFVDAKDVERRLVDEEDGLSREWQKKSLEAFANSNDISPDYSLSATEKEDLKNTLTPGDKCNDCARRRQAVLAKTKRFRALLKSLFEERKGSSSGLHFYYCSTYNGGFGVYLFFM